MRGDGDGDGDGEGSGEEGSGEEGRGGSQKSRCTPRMLIQSIPLELPAKPSERASKGVLSKGALSEGGREGVRGRGAQHAALCGPPLCVFAAV